MSETWNTTVKELLKIFQLGLNSLLPVMDMAHIAWQAGDAYDDWDEIAQTLYRNIVCRSLADALDAEAKLDNFLPRYNTIYDSYANLSLLEVMLPNDERKAVFVGFSTNGQPFDTVDFLRLDNDNHTTKECEHAKLTDVRIGFRDLSDPEGEAIEELTVTL